MKVTKKLEAEIKGLMDDFWDSYFRGDLEHWRHYLVNDYRNIGGTEEEIWNSKKEILDYTKRIIGQLTGQAEIRNKKTQIIPYDPYIMVHEFMDLFIKIEGKWAFYGKFRLSSLIQKMAGEWKVLHQHGSYPDSHTEQGEAFAFDKLRKENTQLRDAVKRRTIELEEKNRELEIETALEKVRSIAMSMKERVDMLKICKTISLQLGTLGIGETRNVQTAIFNVPEGTYMNYEYYAKHDKTCITETTYTDHKVARAFAAKMLKGKGEVSITYIKGREKVKEWLNYQKSTNVFIDTYLDTATSLTYYWYSLGPVALGISAYTPLTKDEQLLFSRFLKVFELAYRRYLDIEKAETQAREAQIEASLEKVRAQALGMRKPGDLPNVCEVLFKELQSLGFSELRNAMVNIHDDEKRTFVNYDYSDAIGKSSTPLFYDIHPVIKKQIKQIRSADDAFSETVFKGRDLESWKAFRKSRGEKEDKRIRNSTALYYYFYSIGTGSIGISAFTAISEEKQQLLKRFRNVFAFAYRRYMDVAQAEAQAREAQIELALERVRARAMAMHNSGELAELVSTVFREMTRLGFTLTSCIIWINDHEKASNTLWMASAEMKKPAQPFAVQPFHKDFFSSVIHAWKARDPKWVYTMTGAGKKSFENAFLRELPGLPDPLRKAIKAPKQLVFSASFNQFGALEIVETEALDDEKFELLHRFGKVFEQTYTRFLDLQKAEAQAREAQIELGLERVRARAMAMQKSDELSELVDTVFKELTKLDFALAWCIINIIDESSMSNTVWAANPDINKAPESYHMLFEDYPFHHAMMNGYKEKAQKYIYVIEGEEKKVYDEYLFNETEFRKVPAAAQAASRAMEKYVVSFTFSNFGGLQTVGDGPLSAANLDILSRFGKVFDLTYTRFNDLQKAEAQARESHIQLALERVRARTMAMQRSDELPETSYILFQQMKELGEPAEQLSIGVVHEENNVIEISATLHGGILNKVYWHSINEPFVMNKVYQAWKTQQKTLIIELKGDQLNAYNKYRNELTKSEMFPTDFDDEHRRLVYAAFFSKGMLAFAVNEPRPPQSLELLERFASVFDLTYTRFLDLQKAEAQAREAKIEAALERVRSRTMGMQKSEELKEVIQVVYDQFVHLNIRVDHTGFVMDYKTRDDYHIWIADHIGAPSQVTIPYFESVYYDRFNAAKEKGLDFFASNLTFDEKNQFYQELFKHVPGLPEKSKEFLLHCPGLAISTVLLENVGLYIENFSGIPYSDEENTTLMRFGKVFQQTYTRFHDLQKAEAQAREAKIEAALERVRSKAMSMQKSEDLANAVGIAFEELDKLNPGVMRCGIGILNKEKRSGQIWTTTISENNTVVQVSGDQAMDVHPLLQGAFEAWVSQEADYSYILKGDDLNNYYKALIDEDFRLPDSQSLVAGADGLVQYYYVAVFSSGGLFAFRETAFPEEAKLVLRRFADVFSLTYTRFNDLQKAEALALQAGSDLLKLKEEKKRTEEALVELKSTQSQLIQSEKMASLGELTAGIAHEIQNPLNFVNNFSEVSNELLDEMLEEVAKGNYEEVKAIADDVKQNLAKINHHGKRADGIVKGMLQHSRSSSGQKEPTDINALADEYLRLAYHGLRAKDKSFNAAMKTDFDETIGNIHVIPQDMGRVILNLITNAFYEVDKKKKQVGGDYSPTVLVSTKKENGHVTIRVRDNANGIPPKILDKIFQPFFSTKPTGQGTGLGLSLSYDIVKAHGGELKVETKEGEGTEFIIRLPV